MRSGARKFERERLGKFSGIILSYIEQARRFYFAKFIYTTVCCCAQPLGKTPARFIAKCFPRDTVGTSRIPSLLSLKILIESRLCERKKTREDYGKDYGKIGRS